ncbi:protein S40-5-like [Lycium barbarum]|uniref:protein S40-5-like n=1 Tax=Lycium barbarum TaxID=112863 RepID=UPI00293E4838|nr:protein S40-5-like [Lycium barbarum]
MAKGRKLTISMSERYLGSYSYNHGNETVNETSELGEDDVWSTVDDMVNADDRLLNGSRNARDSRATRESNGSMSSFTSCRQGGGLSLAFNDTGKATSSMIIHQFRGQDSVAQSSPRGRHMASSAPVNVPDWSKIYRVDSVESFHVLDDGVDDHVFDMVPPHEYLARGYGRARKSMTNTSVFEGVGRTLKGRDLSRVRDAVWSQTGFNG